MNTDPGIVCFQHCSTKIFCFHLPEQCPVCNRSLSSGIFQILPFRVPYPFARAIQYPCSVVIKPTFGDFLNDYLNSMDLHIGLTDSIGHVIEFDKNGLRKHKSDSWNQCLVLDSTDELMTEHWDETLERVIADDRWTQDMYNEHTFNCYTFVLQFLQELGYGELSEAASDKTNFCERFIVPRTTAAGKYISLYRKLLDAKYYIHNHQNVQPSAYPESVPSR